MKRTNREILLEGTANIEQFENGERIGDLTINISDYPDAVDDALNRFETKEDVLTQMIDNLSDMTEEAVVCFSIDEESLSLTD